MNKVSIKDIVDGTPSGKKAVEKALKQSVKDMEAMSRKAKSMPKHEHSDELNEIFAPLIDSPSLTLTSTYWEGAKQAIQDWHTRQLQDFANKVESEAERMYYPNHVGSTLAVPVEALNKLLGEQL